MATVSEGLEKLRYWVRQGKGHLHLPHLVIIEEEAKARAENKPIEGKRKTRVAWDTEDPEVYSEWHRERERWMKRANKNPTLATEIMILGLKAYSDQGIDALIEALGAVRAGQAVPKAEEPEPTSDAAAQQDEDFLLGRQGLDDA